MHRLPSLSRDQLHVFSLHDVFAVFSKIACDRFFQINVCFLQKKDFLSFVVMFWQSANKLQDSLVFLLTNRPSE